MPLVYESITIKRGCWNYDVYTFIIYYIIFWIRFYVVPNLSFSDHDANMLGDCDMSSVVS